MVITATLDSPPLKEFYPEPLDLLLRRSEGEAFAKISHGTSVVAVHKIFHSTRL